MISTLLPVHVGVPLSAQTRQCTLEWQASGEPCPMCSAAMVWAGVSRIVFAASAPEFAKILTGGPQFSLRCADVVAAADVDIAVEGPILQDEALTVMR
ncbi:MAG: hypothetical protein WBQ44_16205 [Rhodococcus sp. (in: high G+C Gram-positive bacteria)]